MSTTVHVEGISTQTSEKEVRDFFSFCGKIASLSVKPGDSGSQTATVTFEKETAAKTALLLDSTQLGPAQVKVTSSGASSDTKGLDASADASKDEGDVAQEDKPRSRIIAEYLAHGYTISDKAIERALALDQQHGISTRFTTALKAFDDRFKASEKAVAVDAKLGVSDKAVAGWRGMNSYFEKALGTPTGQRVRKFYEEGNKQVVDVHNEARHLADLKTGKSPTSATQVEKVLGTDKTKCNCAADGGKCLCAPGSCACADCALNSDVEPKVGAEEANLETVPGTEKTKCNCQGAEGKCACAPGKCACASCNKNPDVAPGSTAAKLNA